MMKPQPMKFGPWQLPTIESARKLVFGGCAVYKDRPADMLWAERVAQWIASTGDCLWHAVYEVNSAAFGKKLACHCANCNPRPFSL